jgi:hypothetical protein
VNLYGNPILNPKTDQPTAADLDALTVAVVGGLHDHARCNIGFGTADAESCATFKSESGENPTECNRLFSDTLYVTAFADNTAEEIGSIDSLESGLTIDWTTVSGDGRGFGFLLLGNAAGIESTLAQTLEDVSASATASLELSGTAEPTLEHLGSTSVGELAIEGGVTPTLDDAALDASGVGPGAPITGSSTQTLGDLASTAIGELDVVGSTSTTLEAATLQASGEVALTGSTTGALDPITLEASGTSSEVATGSTDQTLDALTSVGAGELAISGSSGQTLAPLASVAVATLALIGNVAATLEAVTLGGGDALGLFELLKVRIGDWLGADTNRLPEQARGDALNLIQRQVLCNHDLRYGEVNDTLTLQAGVPTYALPTEWRWVLSLGYTNPSTGSRIDLIRLSKEAFDIRYPDPTDTGPPRHYAIWETVLYIGPTPDQNLTLNRNWYRYLPDLENGAPNNTNAFVEQAWDVLFFGALAHISRYMLEDSRAPMWEEKFMELEADLAGEHEREKRPGRVPIPQLTEGSP